MDRQPNNMEVLERQLQAIDSMANVRGRTCQTANVWIYHSPKNGKRFALEGDAPFFACILYEGDPSVSSYSPERSEVVVMFGPHTVTIKYDIKVYYVDGRVDWVKLVSKSNAKALTDAKMPNGAQCITIDGREQGQYSIVTKDELAVRKIEFDNWLVLCSAMTRTMYYSLHREASVLAKILNAHKGMSVAELMQLNDIDPAQMLSAIAHGLRTKTFHCNLTRNLFTQSTIISVGDSADLPVKGYTLKWAERTSIPSIDYSAPKSNATVSDDPEKWPSPDASSFPTSKKDAYFMRRNAVLMRLKDGNPSAVTNEYGISDREQRRLIERCKEPSSSGGIVGFYACIPGYRTKGYERTKPLAQDFISEKGGYSGALSLIFRRHPLVQKRIEDLYLKKSIKGHVHEFKISKRRIWQEFKKELRELGYSDADWPFNTVDQAYGSICAYVNTLHQGNYKAAVQARYGVEAARRTAIGTGEIPLISARRPYSVMQLDYQLVDAHSIIVIRNKYHVEIEVRVKRWYYGLMGDESNGLITGIFIGYETTPTSDCALKIIDSSLRPQVYNDDDPRVAYIADGKILPNELIPELTHQCFNVLRVDNAWANAARNTVNSIIDVVGCAVNFGPPRAWWTRAAEERINRDLTNRGLQRLPSSTGTGPEDPLKQNPMSKASVFRIAIEELTGLLCGAARAHNESVSSGREYSSPLEAIRAALAHERSGLIRQPLPKKALEDKRLLTHVHECTVYGKPKEGIRPRVKWDECTYTNSILSMRDDLIGSTLILYSNLDDVRDVVATVKETGEDIGALIPQARWRDHAVSVRHRKLINRHGTAKRNKSVVDDAFTGWQEEKSEELANKERESRQPKRKPSISATEAIMLRSQPANNESTNPRIADRPAVSSEKPTTLSGFGEVDVSSLFTVVRKR